jgi:hypothetical protein
MKCRSLVKLLSLLVLFSFGCSTQNEVRPRPEDFSVQYEWREGGLPSPSYYAYTIRIGPAVQGEIVFSPDHSSNNPPVWTETFSVEDGDLEKLYVLMSEKGMFTKSWQQEDIPPADETVEWLEVTAHGEHFLVPRYVAGEKEAEAIQEVYAGINSLVPGTVWAKLYSQREQYEQDFNKESVLGSVP